MNTDKAPRGIKSNCRGVPRAGPFPEGAVKPRPYAQPSRSKLRGIRPTGNKKSKRGFADREICTVKLIGLVSISPSRVNPRNPWLIQSDRFLN